MKQIEADKKEADVTQKVVAVEEITATEEASRANAIKERAENSVADANKILD